MTEEVDMTKAGGEGASQSPDEAFTEEYVTGDFGMREYDYSYKDYNEPAPEGETDANHMGPVLSAVTDEGGVSQTRSTPNPHFRSHAGTEMRLVLANSLPYTCTVYALWI